MTKRMIWVFEKDKGSMSEFVNSAVVKLPEPPDELTITYVYKFCDLCTGPVNRKVFAANNILSLPTFILIHNNREIGRLYGATERTKAKLAKFSQF